MDLEELPADVRDKVIELRSKGGPRAEMVEVLLRKRAAATPEKRAGVERLIMDLDKPDIGAWIAGGIIALAVVAAGAEWFVEHRHQQAVAAGVPTVARVVRMDQGDCWFNDDDHVCVKLTLSVHPTRRDPYDATLDHSVDERWVSRIQPGNWITVAVDSADATRVYFDEGAMAVPPPTPPSSSMPPR